MIKRKLSFLKQSCLGLFYKPIDENPIFIVGCGHSGTTLMLRILANHKDVYAVPYESFVFKYPPTKYSVLMGWNKEMKLTKSSRLVEKTPRHILRLEKIFDLFKNARVIIMVRDGRDSVVSIRQRYGNTEMGYERWIRDNKAGLKYLDDNRVLFVRLEDFITAPSKKMQEICDHVKLNFYEELMDYQEKSFDYENSKAEKVTGRSGEDHQKNRNWQVNQPIFKDTSKWEKEATEEELILFENKEFLSVMKRMGYVN